MALECHPIKKSVSYSSHASLVPIHRPRWRKGLSVVKLGGVQFLNLSYVYPINRALDAPETWSRLEKFSSSELSVPRQPVSFPTTLQRAHVQQHPCAWLHLLFIYMCGFLIANVLRQGPVWRGLRFRCTKTENLPLWWTQTFFTWRWLICRMRCSEKPVTSVYTGNVDTVRCSVIVHDFQLFQFLHQDVGETVEKLSDASIAVSICALFCKNLRSFQLRTSWYVSWGEEPHSWKGKLSTKLL